MTRQRLILLVSVLIIIPAIFYFYSISAKKSDLDGFYRWTREDPLYFAPDTRTSKMEATDKIIDKIDSDQKKILNFLTNKESAYPIGFLKSFVKTNIQTDTFLHNPTLSNAKTLIAYQKETVKLYKKESTAINSILKSKYPDAGSIYVALNVAQSLDTVISDLEKISKSTDLIEAEIDAREKCLYGNGSCKKPSDNFQKPTRVVEVSTAQPKNLLGDILLLNKNYKSLKGPYVAKTPCFGFNSDLSIPNHYFYVLGDFATNPGIIHSVELADEIYFKHIYETAASKDEAALAKQGIKYVYSPSSAPYQCNDKTYISEVSEIYLFLYYNKPIGDLLNAQEFSDSKLINDFKKSEENFFNTKYQSYEDMHVLATYYGYLYKIILADSNLSKKYKEFAYQALNRKLMIDNKLGGIPSIMQYGELYVNSNIYLQENRLDNSFSDFYHGFRNFYNIMYLPFSPAVYRGQPLNYIEKIYVKDAVTLDGDFMSYSQAITKYSQSEVRSWFIKTPSVN